MIRCRGTLFYLVLLFFFAPRALQAASPCGVCDVFGSATVLGQVPFNGLTEASGLAASRRNYNVFWTHNDGSQGRIFALSTNGTRLATFDLTRNVDDVEDVAVGPGPVSGVSYLYVGDTGAAGQTTGVRPEIEVFRIPEPFVDLAWSTNARTFDFFGVDSFTLVYPDGAYDAEALMIDPVTADVWVATKEVGFTRLYRANLNTAEDRDTVSLQFVQTLPFSEPSGADISADGSQIMLRREDAAQLWVRCAGESVVNALSRPPVAAPVIGPPLEPNGEAIAFLADGTGYATISEGNNPTLYMFPGLCTRAPQMMVVPTNQTVFAGATVSLVAAAGGNPSPLYSWSFNGSPIAGQTNGTLVMSNVTSFSAGEYRVVASNTEGSTSAVATLVVHTMPQLRITEVMSDPMGGNGVAVADWWELTNFEQQPVTLTGWRFNDNNGGLTDPYRITNPVVIGPGESIIFVEGLNASEFRAWWGSANLPDSLQIVTYGGSGLGLGAGGDSVRLWDATTTSAAEPIDGVTFGAATTGVTFGFNPGTGTFGELSQLGVNGAFNAAASNDIGSPGRISVPPSAPLLNITQDGAAMVITFAAEAGRRYSLQSRSDFEDTEWSNTGDVWTASSAGTALFRVPADSAMRFFRVVVE